MRPIFSCISISTALMLASVTSLAASSYPNNADVEGKTIYGLSNAKHFTARSNGKFYIQTGSFKSIKNANIYKLNLIKKYDKPVIVKKLGSYYVVYIGPIHSAAEVRALNNSGNRVVPVPQEVTRPLLIPEQQNQHQLDARGIDEEIITFKDPSHFEAIGALGVANLNAGNGYLGVTSSETDELIQTNGNDWNTFTGQLGAGYVYYLQGAQLYSENTQWFPSVEPEINGYYLSRNSIQGEVWRFSNPNFNDMTYNMPVESFRLMFDTALTLVSKKQYSLYAIGGIGNAWNRVGYNDADNNGLPCPDQFLNLNTTTRGSFAWEVGTGLSYAINDRFALSLEYLYADLGTVKTPANGFTGTITTPLIVPASFKLTSQAALLGLHVAI